MKHELRYIDLLIILCIAWLVFRHQAIREQITVIARAIFGGP